MRLISYLSSNQKANLENDYEENQGHQFACVEKLKKYKVPMLYYNDKIPDVRSRFSLYLYSLWVKFNQDSVEFPNPDAGESKKAIVRER